jgi:hypothetical protein
MKQSGATTMQDIKPTIHLGGTSRQQLEDDYMQAMDAVRQAFTVYTVRAAPHGRDYYTQPPGAYEDALHEFQEQSDALLSIASDLEKTIIHIQNHY